MRRSNPLVLLFAAVAAACSGGELVGVHVRLAADGSGTVTTRALTAPTEGGRAETLAGGAKWTLRAALVASQGSFDRIGELQLGDGSLTFTPDLDGERPGLRVRFARGADAPWISSLVPDLETRRRMAKAHDPSGRTKEIADVLRIEIETPGTVITSGVLPSGRGVSADREQKRAILLLPVRTVVEAGEDFVWELSWLRP